MNNGEKIELLNRSESWGSRVGKKGTTCIKLCGGGGNDRLMAVGGIRKTEKKRRHKEGVGVTLSEKERSCV